MKVSENNRIVAVASVPHEDDIDSGSVEEDAENTNGKIASDNEKF